MKKLLLFIGFLLAISYSYAQAGDICFLHTVTTANTSGFVSYIDHPALNNNPSAKVLIAHNLGSDGSITRNDNSTGLYYSTSEQKWSILSEGATTPIESSSYNVYVAGTAGNIILHTAVGGTYFEHVSHALLDNNPNAKPILTTVWNTTGGYNDGNYGFDYDTSGNKWWIYHESLSGTIPTGATFNILVEPALVAYNSNISFMHQATVANQSGSDGTLIDHPLLNNNPTAYFVMTHNYDPAGVSGGTVGANHTFGTYYHTSQQKWVIFSEDFAALNSGETFNIALQLPPPFNDDPVATEVIVGAHGSTCTTPTYMTNVGATDSTGVFGLPTPSCGNYLGGDVFYFFEVPPSGQVIISRTNDDWDFLSYSLHGPTWATEIECGSINNGVTDSAIITGLTPGMDVGLRFWEWNNNSYGSEGFCVREHDPSAGIADAIIEGFSMFPNPVENILNLSAVNAIENVSIYNLLGQEVLQTTPATTQVEIDMSVLSTGSYIVKVQTGNQIGSYNLIKQ